MKKTITFSILIFAALTLCSCSDSENSSENEKNAPQKEDQNVACIINEEEIDFNIVVTQKNDSKNLVILVENTGCAINTNWKYFMRVYDKDGTKRIDNTTEPDKAQSKLWRKGGTKAIAFTHKDDGFSVYKISLVELTITTPHGSRTKSFNMSEYETSLDN